MKAAGTKSKQEEEEQDEESSDEDAYQSDVDEVVTYLVNRESLDAVILTFFKVVHMDNPMNDPLMSSNFPSSSDAPEGKRLSGIVCIEIIVLCFRVQALRTTENGVMVAAAQKKIKEQRNSKARGKGQSSSLRHRTKNQQLLLQVLGLVPCLL